MQLRGYQIKAISDIRAAFQSGYRKICFTSPCGSGKTVLIVFMANEAAKRGNRVIFLVHRVELISQTAETFDEIGVNYGIIAPGFKETDDLIQIASVQTLSRRLSKAQKPQLIIADEHHHSVAKTWLNIFNYWPDAYVVGLTATPQRLGNQGLKEVSDVLILGPTTKELIAAGHLSPFRYFAPPPVANLEGITIKMGDYDTKELAIRMDKSVVTGNAVEHYQQLAAGKKAIAYCVSRDHSIHTAEGFNAANIPSRHIDGETPREERKRIIEDFRAGRIRILTNCELVSEGFNVPTMEAVILLRPTQSTTLFLQQAMRPLRRDPENPEKQAVILDCVGNVFRHGAVDEDREWSLDGIKKRRQADGPTVSIRQCPQCFAVHPPSPKCPYCQHEYVMTPRQLAEEAGTLVEFMAMEKKTARMEVGMCRDQTELTEIAITRNYAKGWVEFKCKAKHISFTWSQLHKDWARIKGEKGLR
jgi:superfamily II DNA or RNA helicase